MVKCYIISTVTALTTGGANIFHYLREKSTCTPVVHEAARERERCNTDAGCTVVLSSNEEIGS